MLRRLAAYLAYAYVAFVGWATRTAVVRGENRNRLRGRDQRFIYALWHQRQVFAVWAHRRGGAAALVSRSADGELAARILILLGIGVVRGSSSRGGASALRELLKARRDLAITPDGPRGPAREVKEGILFLARKLEIPILPLSIGLSRKLVFKKSWDEFWLPLPFGRAAVVYGEPLAVGPDDDLKVKAAELKAALLRLDAQADGLVS